MPEYYCLLNINGSETVDHPGNDYRTVTQFI